ncbi:MAG: 30S ribosomal protein S16 [Candidatus Pacebacteria bacterium]|nr:30S ribosomal protein S16 [Candidatus Paceibacterota bacterium]
MLKIRLQRIGRRNEPHFRAVVAESSRGPKSGDVIEVVGSYNPKLGNIQLNNERIAYWIQKGAQPSGTVHNFLVDAKIIDGPKINVLPKKSPVIDEAKIAAEKAAAEKAEADRLAAEAAAKAEAEAPVEEVVAETTTPEAVEEEAPAEVVAETPAE